MAKEHYVYGLYINRERFDLCGYFLRLQGEVVRVTGLPERACKFFNIQDAEDFATAHGWELNCSVKEGKITAFVCELPGVRS